MPNGIPSRRRQISTTATGSNDDTGHDGFGALDEEGRGGGVGFGPVSSDGTGHRCSSATRRPSRLVARILTVAERDEDRLDHVGRGVQDVLAVVEHEQPRPPLQRRGHAVDQGHPRLLNDAQHARNRVGHGRRITDRGQLDHPHPVGEVGRRPRGHLQREPRLADPADTGQRHQPVRLERGRPHRRVPIPGRSGWWSVAAGCPASNPRSSAAGTPRADPAAWTWNTSTGLAMSRSRRGPNATRSTPVSSPRGEAVDQDLAAVACRHHPCRAVQHGAEVVLAAQLGLTGRDAHPNRQVQRALRGDRGIDGRPWRFERRAYPVAGVLEQPTVVRRNGLAQDLVVGDQRRAASNPRPPPTDGSNLRCR